MNCIPVNSISSSHIKSTGKVCHRHSFHPNLQSNLCTKGVTCNYFLGFLPCADDTLHAMQPLEEQSTLCPLAERHEWYEVEVQKGSPALQQRCEWCLESNAKNAHIKGTVLVKLVEYSKENGAITIHPAIFTKFIKRIFTLYKLYAKILPIPNHHWRGAVPSRTDTSNCSYLGLVS